MGTGGPCGLCIDRAATRPIARSESGSKPITKSPLPTLDSPPPGKSPMPASTLPARATHSLLWRQKSARVHGQDALGRPVAGDSAAKQCGRMARHSVPHPRRPSVGSYPTGARARSSAPGHQGYICADHRLPSRSRSVRHLGTHRRITDWFPRGLSRPGPTAAAVSQQHLQSVVAYSVWILRTPYTRRRPVV